MIKILLSRRLQKGLMECESISWCYVDSFLRYHAGSDGYSASWKHCDIVSHRTYANFLMNYPRPSTKLTSGC